jgi:uncharacterized protein involved in exopolysaccharide biosynthesis
MVGSGTQVGWQDYLAIIWRRRWFFLAPTVVVLVSSLIVGMFLPKIYRAETIILVQEESIINPLIQGLAVSTPVQDRLKTLREEILSWTSLSRLAHDLKLDQGAKSPLAFERLIKQLQQDISVQMKGRDLIRISYENEDPKLAQQLVNTVSTIFLERNMLAQSAESETAIAFIKREMDVYQEKLEASEGSLREFKEVFVSQMPVAVELNEQIISLEVALSRLQIENTDEHPTVVDTRRRIHELKSKRNEELKRFIASAIARGQDPAVYDGLMSALDGRSASTDKIAPQQLKEAQEAYNAWVLRLDNSKNVPQQGNQTIQVVTDPKGVGTTGSTTLDVSGPLSISLAPWQEQELMRLTRDYEVNAQTYQHLQERLEKAKITQRLGESDEGLKFKVLEPARMPLRPVKPNLFKIGTFALLFGMFIGAGIAFLAEYLDQSFQNAEELQSVLEVPVLGSISTIVTEDDMVRRRQEMKTWVSPKGWRNRLSDLSKPVTRRVDALLLKWGL